MLLIDIKHNYSRFTLFNPVGKLNKVGVNKTIIILS